MKDSFSRIIKPDTAISNSFNETMDTIKRYTLYFVGVLICLIVIQYIFVYISNNVAPEDLYSYLVADPAHPTIPGMFFANYLHKSWFHLLGNILYTALAFICIVLVYLLRNIKYIPLSSTYFYGLFFLLLLFPLPFIISGVSMVSSTISGGSVGFSGIAYAFIGAFFGLLVYPLYSLYTEIFQSPRFNKIVGLSICTLYTIILIWVLLTINPVWVDSNINYVAHVTGAIFGYLFSIIYDQIHRSVCPE